MTNHTSSRLSISPKREYEKGKWAVKDGKTCFDDDGAKPEVCYTDSAPAADGSFTATEADGKVTQVKPHAKM